MTLGFVPAPPGADRSVLLTRDEARARTEEVKADARVLWQKMLALYDDGAHWALGYRTWPAYLSAEFNIAEAHAYRLLRAARVDRALDQCPSPTGLSARPSSERVARELAPVLDDGPEAVRETWDRMVQTHGSKPTATQVRETLGGAVGDAQNGTGVVVEARCPMCNQAIQAELVEDGPAKAPEPVGSLADGIPAWMADPGPEPGWTPLVDDADLRGAAEGDLAA